MRSATATLLAAIVVLCAGPASGDAIEDWVNVYNGPGGSHDYGRAIALDDSGNIYVAGASSVGFDGDITTIKYDPEGDERWLETHTDPAGGHNSARDIAFFGGYVYVLAQIEGATTDDDYVTIKYTLGGTEEWAERYNGPADGRDVPRALAVDDSGNVYVTGASQGGVTGYDIATPKYRADGQLQWERQYDGYAGFYDSGLDIALDAQANVYVSGYSDSSRLDTDIVVLKYSRGGVLQWDVGFDGSDDEDHQYCGIAVTPDGYSCVTAPQAEAGTPWDYFVVRLTPGGGEDWRATYDGDGGEDMPTAIALDDSACVYVTGRSHGATSSADYATVKFGPDGVQRWAMRYNGDGNAWDGARALALDADGNAYVTGESDQGATGRDCVTIRYSRARGEDWVMKYEGGASEGDYGDAIIVDGDGNVCVTGSTRASYLHSDFTTIKYSQTSPVEGAFYAVVTNDGAVVLRWTVGSLAGIEGFNVYRALRPDGPFARVSEDPIAPSSPGEFEDATVWPGTTFWYELRALLWDGTEDVVGPALASATTGGALSLRLFPVRPNPTAAASQLLFDVPNTTGPVRLAVYNVRGELVKTLLDGHVERGRHETSWDGTDRSGSAVSAGVYLVRLEAEGQVRTAKTLLVR